MEILFQGEETWINDIRLKPGQNWVEGDRLTRLLENPIAKQLIAINALQIPSQAQQEEADVKELVVSKKNKVNGNT